MRRVTVAVAATGSEAAHPVSVLSLLLTHFFLGKIIVVRPNFVFQIPT